MSACVYVRWVDCIIGSRQDKVTVPVWVTVFVAQTLNRKNNDGHTVFTQLHMTKVGDLT